MGRADDTSSNDWDYVISTCLYLLWPSILVWDPFAIKLIFWRILQSSEWALILLILVELKISLEKKRKHKVMTWYHENMHLSKHNSIKWSSLLFSKDLLNVWFWKQQQVSHPDSSSHPCDIPRPLFSIHHCSLWGVGAKKVHQCLYENVFALLEPLDGPSFLQDTCSQVGPHLSVEIKLHSKAKAVARLTLSSGKVTAQIKFSTARRSQQHQYYHSNRNPN